MKKVCMALALIAVILVLPAAAYAGDGTISDSGTYDLGDYGNGSVITINTGLTVTLTDTAGTTYENIQIVCSHGVTLTLNGIKIDNTSYDNACPLSFDGSGNALILEGESALKAGQNQPGVKAEAGTSLEISGGGTLDTAGGAGGAGLGSGNDNDSGTVTIEGGTITAQGGDSGAGIGGGSNSEGGKINISNGTVTATGGSHGAGIGGGYNCVSGGDITITGATISATGGAGGAGLGGGEHGSGGGITIADGQIHAAGGENGAGIGGGYYGSGGSITIEDGTIAAQGGGDYGAGVGGGGYGAGGNIAIAGGTVDAAGGKYGAGVGGGYYRAGGTITVSGGVVTAAGGQYGAGIGGGYRGAAGTIAFSSGRIYAQKGADALHDVGCGSNGSGGSLDYSGDTAVFLKNEACIDPTEPYKYSYVKITSVTDDMVYGVPANGWEPPFRVYMKVYPLSYSVNGGTGTVPGMLWQHKNTTTIIASGEGLSKGGKAFVCWNTWSNGMGENYSGGTEVKFGEVTGLYAMYTQIGIKVDTVSYNSITLKWTAFPGASGYEIHRSRTENGTFNKVKTIKGGSVSTYKDKPLVFLATYYYKVRAFWYEGGKKMYSDYSDIIFDSPAFSDVSGVKAVAYYPTKAKLTWNAVPGRTKYEVWQSNLGGGWDRVGSTKHTYYYLSHLQPFKTYSYWIKVYRLVGKKKIYYEGDNDQSTVNVRTILDNVANVTAAPASASSIKVSWSRVKGASGYEVWRSTEEGGVYTLIKSTTNKYYTDPNRIPNTTYYYYVKAYFKVRESRRYSTACAPVHATPYLGPVTNLKAARYSATKIKLTWSPVSGRTGYEIYRAASADGEYTLIKSITDTYYYDGSLTTGVTYYYKVLAYRTVSGVRYHSRELTAVAAASATP